MEGNLKSDLTVALNVYMPNLNSRDGMDGDSRTFFSVFFFCRWSKPTNPNMSLKCWKMFALMDALKYIDEIYDTNVNDCQF